MVQPTKLSAEIGPLAGWGVPIAMNAWTHRRDRLLRAANAATVVRVTFTNAGSPTEVTARLSEDLRSTIRCA
jgi:hypothetical protein